jgi:hypothetical protein
MLSLTFSSSLADCHYAECCYAYCHYAECRGALWVIFMYNKLVCLTFLITTFVSKQSALIVLAATCLNCLASNAAAYSGIF